MLDSVATSVTKGPAPTVFRLTHLPTELIAQCIKGLSTRDYVALSMTQHKVREVAERWLYRHIAIEKSKEWDGFTAETARIKLLYRSLRTRPTLARHLRSLSVHAVTFQKTNLVEYDGPVNPDRRTMPSTVALTHQVDFAMKILNMTHNLQHLAMTCTALPGDRHESAVGLANASHLGHIHRIYLLGATIGMPWPRLPRLETIEIDMMLIAPMWFGQPSVHSMFIGPNWLLPVHVKSYARAANLTTLIWVRRYMSWTADLNTGGDTAMSAVAAQTLDKFTGLRRLEFRLDFDDWDRHANEPTMARTLYERHLQGSFDVLLGANNISDNMAARLTELHVTLWRSQDRSAPIYMYPVDSLYPAQPQLLHRFTALSNLVIVASALHSWQSCLFPGKPPALVLPPKLQTLVIYMPSAETVPWMLQIAEFKHMLPHLRKIVLAFHDVGEGKAFYEILTTTKVMLEMKHALGAKGVQFVARYIPDTRDVAWTTDERLPTSLLAYGN